MRDRTIEQVSAELQRIDPLAFPEIERIQVVEDRQVIAVRVSRGPSPPYQYRRAAYRRVGNTTRAMSANEYNRMLFERMHSEQRWENQPAAGWTVDDLDVSEIRNTVAEAVRIGRLNEPGSREPRDLLRGLGLLRGDMLFRAAAVLFGSAERLEFEMPQCLLRVARFRGINRYDVGLFTVIERFLRRTLRHLRKAGAPVEGCIRKMSLEGMKDAFRKIDVPITEPNQDWHALMGMKLVRNCITHYDGHPGKEMAKKLKDGYKIPVIEERWKRTNGGKSEPVSWRIQLADEYFGESAELVERVCKRAARGHYKYM